MSHKQFEQTKERMDVMEIESLVRSRSENKSESLPWVEKYRPKNFDELISHNDIVSTRSFFFLVRSFF
jgi:hypothetical protein